MSVAAGSTDWRTLYDYKMEEYQEREQAVGQRLRQLAAQCAEQKNSRTMQVSLCMCMLMPSSSLLNPCGHVRSLSNSANKWYEAAGMLLLVCQIMQNMMVPLLFLILRDYVASHKDGRC